MWILIVNYISGNCNLISAGNIPALEDVEGQEEFITSLGYDVDHVDWFIFDDKPTFEVFRYDEETDDIYPVWC